MDILDNEHWLNLLQYLPEGWEKAMHDTGLLSRKRNFKDERDLLRTLLMYLSYDNSLVATSTHASISGIAQCSDVALLKRLRNSADFFEWLNNKLLAKRGLDYAPLTTFRNYNVYAVDASVVSEPGSTGTDWRLHYSLELATLKCHQFKVTRQNIGETFLNFTVNKNDLFLGDRAYGRYKSMMYLKQNGADFVVRYMNKAFSMEQEDGKQFEMYDKVKNIKIGEVVEFKAYVYAGNAEKLPVRFCIIKKGTAEAEKSIAKAKKEMSKKQRKVNPKTLELHRYVILMTSLPEEISAFDVMELYRLRWQVELAFKRLKSIFGLGHLPKKDINSARAWLQGKIFLSMLTQWFSDENYLFSPWGYPKKKPDKMLMA